MTNKPMHRRMVLHAILTVVGLTLSSGCRPDEFAADLGTFVKDLLLSAAAAYLL